MNPYPRAAAIVALAAAALTASAQPDLYFNANIYTMDPERPRAEAMLVEDLGRGEFCEGDTPSIADCCLIPQVYNARRFGVDLTPFPNIRQIEAACLARPEFDAARPEVQPDAPRND